MAVVIGYAVSAAGAAALVGCLFFGGVLTDRAVEWNSRRRARAARYRRRGGRA